MSRIKSLFTFITVFLMVSVIGISLLTAAAEPQTGLMAQVLDMYKYDQYLPAIDVLEQNAAGNEKVFNYWLYLGLGYQRTGQTAKAITAYEKAAELNPDAGNLASRIRTLRIETRRLDYKHVQLDSPEQKADWLMKLAGSLRREGQEERSLRLFLQAVDYDASLLSNDDDFIRRGEVFYQLKMADKAEHAELYHGIFKFLQGEHETAHKDLQTFLRAAARPVALELLARKFIDRIDQVKKSNLAAIQSEPAPAKAPQTASPAASLAARPAETRSAAQNLGEIEKQLADSTPKVSSDNDDGFVNRFAEAITSRMIADLAGIEEPQQRCRLLWELGQSRLQKPEIMETLIDELGAEDPRCVTAACEAIAKIGPPAADKAVDGLLKLLDHPEKPLQFLAIELLGKIRSQPDRVLPVLVARYAREQDSYQQRHIYYWVNKFGQPGTEILYRILNDTARVDRKPVAELLSRMTGEKIQDLINR